jgi:hypothetical protein
MMSQLGLLEPYESSRKLANLVIALLIVHIALQLLAAGSTFMHIDLLYKIMEEMTAVARAQQLAGERREAIIRIIQLVVFTVSAIVFLIWLRRAYKNLKPLGAEPRHPSAWVIGAFIVPIINLFLPFQIFQEMWRASDPETIAARDAKPVTAFIEDSSKSLLAVVWWGLWLLTLINLVVAYRWHISWQILNDEIIASWLIIMLSLLLILDSIAMIVLVKKITDRQDEKIKRLAALAAPPEDLSQPQQA